MLASNHQRSGSPQFTETKETCLVKSYNSSLRDTFARFHRKTKAFSRSIEAIEHSLLIFAHKDLYINNIKRYSNFGRIISSENIIDETKEEKEKIVAWEIMKKWRPEPKCKKIFDFKK